MISDSVTQWLAIHTDTVLSSTVNKSHTVVMCAEFEKECTRNCEQTDWGNQNVRLRRQ